MFIQSIERPGALAAISAGRRDEHHGIHTIGRLVLLCTIGLTIAAVLLVATAFQVARSLDDADLADERRQAANAIDTMVAAEGPLTEAGAAIVGRIAGLERAHLAYGLAQDSSLEQIPLLAGQGPSGSYLTWSRVTVAQQIFLRFAPIRLPIIGGLLLLVVGVLIQLRRIVGDIEQQRRLAHRQSRSDTVTGLANRLAFETALAELVAEGRRFALLVLDLDRFKAINDELGHPAGDAVLRTVGARLSRLLGPSDLLARVGGDEFMLLRLTGLDRSALAALAQDCIEVVERPIVVAGRSVQVGVSLGLAEAAAKGSAAGLVALADAALYRAKACAGSAFRFAGDGPAQPAFLGPSSPMPA